VQGQGPCAVTATYNFICRSLPLTTPPLAQQQQISAAQRPARDSWYWLRTASTIPRISVMGAAVAVAVAVAEMQRPLRFAVDKYKLWARHTCISILQDQDKLQAKGDQDIQLYFNPDNAVLNSSSCCGYCPCAFRIGKCSSAICR